MSLDPTKVLVSVFFALIVVGIDFVQRGAFSWLSVVAAIPYALLVTAVLYINQFPDYRADQAAGKNHWVVSLGPRRASWGYAAITGLAYGFLVLQVVRGHLPAWCLLALSTVPLSVAASRALVRDAAQPQKLVGAIKSTVVAANLSGLLMAAGLVAPVFLPTLG